MLKGGAELGMLKGGAKLDMLKGGFELVKLKGEFDLNSEAGRAWRRWCSCVMNAQAELDMLNSQSIIKSMWYSPPHQSTVRQTSSLSR